MKSLAPRRATRRSIMATTIGSRPNRSRFATTRTSPVSRLLSRAFRREVFAGREAPCRVGSAVSKEAESLDLPTGNDQSVVVPNLKDSVAT